MIDIHADEPIGLSLIQIATVSQGIFQRFVAVLEIPPVDSAQRAVQVQIVKDVKGKK